MGAKPVSALALAVVPLMADRLVTEELTQLMSGAIEWVGRPTVAPLHPVSSCITVLGDYVAGRRPSFLTLSVM
eukprot:1156796-Pelagomonas_calceolata.AAC.11